MEKYDYRKDKEYLNYLEREEKGAHLTIYDDYLDNPNLEEYANERAEIEEEQKKIEEEERISFQEANGFSDEEKCIY